MPGGVAFQLMRRKGEDTFAMKRRRMPYVAKIKRDDPFRSADRREIEAMVKRIAAAGEHFAIAGWREEAGFLLFHFPTWAKARAMQQLDRPQRHRTPADADALQRAAARRRERQRHIRNAEAASARGERDIFPLDPGPC